MQLDAQKFLSLVEETNQIAFVDLEMTGTRGDYNSILVASILPYKAKKPVTFATDRPGIDRKVALATKNELEKYLCWVTYYGKGFDIPFLNTRLLRWKSLPVESRYHVDMYYVLKYNLLTARRSQGHLLAWMKAPNQKMTVSAESWNEVIACEPGKMDEMIKRCESDTQGLRNLYTETRHVIKDCKK